jgi:hypothetical protein
MSKEYLHNCRTDIDSTRKELTSRESERTVKTRRGYVVAKEVDFNLGDQTKTRFLIATYLGSLYDPDGGYSNREASLNIKLVATNKEAYTHYVRYVQMHNKSNFIAAERGFLNGN